MWDWIEIGSGVVIVGWIGWKIWKSVARARRSYGFLRTTKTNKPLHWPKAELPITCLVAPGVEFYWRAAYVAAAERINDATGLRLLDPRPKVVGSADPRSGNIVFTVHPSPDGRLPGGSGDDVGRTILEWHPETGAIQSAVITVPDPKAHAVQVVVHELGHCLGLDHSSDSDSIMHPMLFVRRAWSQHTLSRADRAALIRAYT